MSSPFYPGGIRDNSPALDGVPTMCSASYPGATPDPGLKFDGVPTISATFYPVGIAENSPTFPTLGTHVAPCISPEGTAEKHRITQFSNRVISAVSVASRL